MRKNCILSIRMDNGSMERLETEAKKIGLNRNEYARMILSDRNKVDSMVFLADLKGWYERWFIEKK